MSYHIVTLILAGILSFADYVTEQVFSKKLKQSKKLVSFSAGVATSYIILSLLPEISTYALIEGRMIFLYILIGFVGLNLTEHYIHYRIHKSDAKGYHKQAHLGYFFMYHFLSGVVLIVFSSQGIGNAVLFFVPFLLYIVAETLPQEFTFKNTLSRMVFSLAPFFGAIIGIIKFDYIVNNFGKIIALMTGTLLYLVIRESIPNEEAERPVFFLLGVVLYTFIIFLTWNLY
jgi:hypothetical protein